MDVRKLSYEPLRRKLIDGLINYQWRLDNPWPQVGEQGKASRAYLNDPIFNAKVNSLAAGVVGVVQDWIREEVSRET